MTYSERKERLKAVILFLFAAVLFFCFACKKVPYIPDEEAVVYLEAIPKVIGPGQESVIGIRGEKGNGYPLPDGTRVGLNASCGEIPTYAVLSDGVAQVSYVAAFGCSGDIEIRATSGRATVSPEVLTITVSENDIGYLFVKAEPQQLPSSGGTSHIEVQGLDENMAPVSGKTVWLEASSGILINGGARETDQYGRIEADLQTQKTAVVKARYKKIESQVQVTVGGNKNPVADFIYSPHDPKSGEAVYFNASASSDSDGYIVSFDWDFGDGNRAQGRTVSHGFQVSVSRTFVVLLKVKDNDGGEGVKAVEIEVEPI